MHAVDEVPRHAAAVVRAPDPGRPSPRRVPRVVAGRLGRRSRRPRPARTSAHRRSPVRGRAPARASRSRYRSVRAARRPPRRPALRAAGQARRAPARARRSARRRGCPRSASRRAAPPPTSAAALRPPGRPPRRASRPAGTRRGSASASGGGPRAAAACALEAGGGRDRGRPGRALEGLACPPSTLQIDWSVNRPGRGDEVRAAAVQLQSTTDIEANLASAERHVRAAAADGAELVVLPERLDIRGGAADYAAGAEPLDGRPVTWARETRRRARDRPRGGLGGGAPRGPRARLEHLRARGARRRDPRGLPQDPHVRRRGRRGGVPRVGALRARGRAGALRDGERRGPRPHHLLRPSLPRALPDPRAARRPRDHGARQLHPGDRRGALGGAAARARDREPGVRDRARPGQAPRARGRQLRQLDDRRPLGRGSRPRAHGGRLLHRGRARPIPPGRGAREAPEPREPRGGCLQMASRRSRA